MKSFFVVLYLTLIEEKDVIKAIAVIAAGIGGGIVKVIIDSRTKKITFFGAVSSLFLSAFLCYICFFYVMNTYSLDTGVIVIGFMGALADRILTYMYTNFQVEEVIKSLINKVWTNSKQ